MSHKLKTYTEEKWERLRGVKPKKTDSKRATSAHELAEDKLLPAAMAASV